VHHNSKTSIDKLEKTGQGRPNRLPVLEEEIKKKAKVYKKKEKRQTNREIQRENSNSKTSFYKYCSLGSVKNLSNN